MLPAIQDKRKETRIPSNHKELRDFLDAKVECITDLIFIGSDPVSIPHRFSEKEDIEISGFLAATIAWGNRVSILRSADRMMSIMGDSPYDFILNHTDKDLRGIDGVIHRTFNAEDFIYFIEALKYIYEEYGGMEEIFTSYRTDSSPQLAIHAFRELFFGMPDNRRTAKHVSDPFKGVSGKKNQYVP